MKHLAIFFIFLFSFFISYSQVNYTFSSSLGSYTPITGGTVLVSGTFDGFNSPSIPLAFNYNCVSVTSIKINADGHIGLGTYFSTSNYTPLSSNINGSIGILSAFGRDLSSSNVGAPEIRHQTIGNEFIAQWSDVRRSGTIGERINFQIRINTSTNVISYVYGEYTAGIANTSYPEIGLKGTNNIFPTNVKNVVLACGASGWLGVTGGTANNSKVCLSGTTVPAIGTTITWTPSSGPAPQTECYETATFNSTTCVWDVSGTQPIQPTLACYETAVFNSTSCSWVVSGTQPSEPTNLSCWQTAAFNTTSCSWDVSGTQAPEPINLSCWQTAAFNTTSCSWVVSGTQAPEPTNLSCWQTAVFNTTSCSWVVSGELQVNIVNVDTIDSYTWIENGQTYTSSGTYQFLDTINCVLEILNLAFTNSISEDFTNNLTLYPNPASNLLKIESSLTDNINFSVYSIDGKLITTGLLVNGKSEIETLNFARGKYFIHLGQNVSTFEVMN